MSYSITPLGADRSVARSSPSPYLYRLGTDLPLMTEAALAEILQPLDSLEVFAADRASAGGASSIAVDSDGIATIPIVGALARNPSARESRSGRTSDTDRIRAMVEKAGADPRISGILLAIDSPGGFFNGGPELSAAVRDARSKKPVVAHVSGLAASLAYMVGSQATKIVMSPSALVGSIGALAIHADLSGFWEYLGVKWDIFRSQGADLKAPGALNTTLSEDQRTTIQSEVDRVAQDFENTVRVGRPSADISALRGRLLMPDDAHARNMIDWSGNEGFARALIRTSPDINR